MQLPYKGKIKLTTPFGKPGEWACGWHTGIDLVGLTDKTVYSVMAGEVAKISSHGAYGNHIIICHDNGLISLYAHLSKINVYAGQAVSAGFPIGVEGNTGNSFGSHLHFEIQKGSYKYPPAGSLPEQCSWLLNPCKVLNIKNIVGEVVQDMAEVKNVPVKLPNGRIISAKGILQDNQNYVVLRPVLEALGYKVVFDGKNILVGGK